MLRRNTSLDSNLASLGDGVDLEAGSLLASSIPASTPATSVSLSRVTILGIFAEINELSERNKKLPGAFGKLSAGAEVFITDFIRGGWSPTVIGLMMHYDPTGWSQLISNVAEVSKILVSAGLIIGAANGFIGIAKNCFSPARETDVFIQQLRDLNERAWNEARALQRLLLVDWSGLATAESNMIPSQLAEIQKQLDIKPEEEYVRLSKPDSKAGMLYTCMQIVLSGANYTASGVLATKLGFDFFGDKIEFNGLDWRAGVGLGVGAALAVIGVGLTAYRARLEEGNLSSTHEEVCLLIKNTESLMDRSRELYEQLRTKCDLAQIDYRVGRGYGTTSDEIKIEHLVTEMKYRVDAISSHAEYIGLFAGNRGAGGLGRVSGFSRS